MAYCRFFVTFDWDETTKIDAVTYELAAEKAEAELKNHFLSTGEKSKAYIFQDHLQIAIINFENN